VLQSLLSQQKYALVQGGLDACAIILGSLIYLIICRRDCQLLTAARPTARNWPAVSFQCRSDASVNAATVLAKEPQKELEINWDSLGFGVAHTGKVDFLLRVQLENHGRGLGN